MKEILAGMHLGQVFGTIIYSILGVIIFICTYGLIAKLSPFSVKKEISEDHNVALGIIIGSVIIGLAIIIAAAIQ
ncbi:MAG: DUF350 domain-containing protein [Candidatus Omnitrophica bacterium]|nr:DUF350 domain-containing protein [Candidatus Omnitrophota bacterium]